MAYRSGNPALTEKTFDNFTNTTLESMTLEGTARKTLVMLFILITAGAGAWYISATQPEIAILGLIGGMVLGLITALVTVFKPSVSPVTAPMYAIAEGVVLGVISQLYDALYDGIVVQAVGLTLGVFIAMLLAYQLRIIRATENFKLGVFAATFGIMIFYLISLGLSFFGVEAPLIHDSGPWGIAFSIFVVIIAALNLVVDFDFVESGVAKRAPKFMEWYGAFGLMVTLVWLYLEILRLLAKSRR